MMNVIFEAVAGSRLFGTQTQFSETDLKRVFIPSVDEIILGEYKEYDERHADKVEDKSGCIEFTDYSLKNFLQSLSSGEVMPIEMLFMNNIEQSEYWDRLLVQKEDLFNQDVLKFYNFPLNILKNYKKNFDRINFLKNLKENLDIHKTVNDLSPDILESPYIKISDNQISIFGKNYRNNASQRFVLQGVDIELNKYTSLEMDETVRRQYVVLAHAYRIAEEGLEYLQTGDILYPRYNAEYLKEIKNGLISQNVLQNQIMDILTQAQKLHNNAHFNNRDLQKEILLSIHKDVIEKYYKVGLTFNKDSFNL